VFDWIRSIGEHLAAMEQVHVVTGGFNGVGDVTGRSYHEQRQQMRRPSNIWHVLPVRDNQVCYLWTVLVNYCIKYPDGVKGA